MIMCYNALMFYDLCGAIKNIPLKLHSDRTQFHTNERVGMTEQKEEELYEPEDITGLPNKSNRYHFIYYDIGKNILRTH